MKAIDPKEIFRQKIIEAIIGAVIFPVIALTAFLVFLFILSYTHILGGPYGIAKFFFWFLAVIYSTIGYVIIKIMQRNKKASDNTNKDTGQVFRDAEVIEK